MHDHTHTCTHAQTRTNANTHAHAQALFDFVALLCNLLAIHVHNKNEALFGGSKFIERGETGVESWSVRDDELMFRLVERRRA